MLKRIFLLALIILPCKVQFSFADSAKSYQEVLIKKAEELNLAANQSWLNMLYYQKSHFSKGYVSIFDSNDFFLSENGKYNPNQELKSNIISFFSDEHLLFENVFGQKQTAQCAFKGRYEWLKEQLQFDGSKLLEQKCQDFEDWYQEINPQSATLIFASAYLNNPASMFGHIFLLINSDADNLNSQILSQTINYSASTAETNGVIFAYKGIFGLYQGQFSNMPYYKMIKKYNNFENRDLWEFKLNLSKKQVRKIMLNIWEINNNYANYYFFSENCSYLLLKLLQVSEPRISGGKKFLNLVIPSDVVVEIVKVPDLVKESKYRQSKVSQINNIASQIGSGIRPLVKKITKNQELTKEENKLISSQEINDQKLFYDLSYQYLQYSYQKEKNKNLEKMSKSALNILTKRSQIKGSTALIEMKSPDSNPTLAHSPKRISVSYGRGNIKKDFTQIDFRLAYHDLLDNNVGFLDGAQINALDLSLRSFADDEIRLNHFNLIDIKSYSAGNYFFWPKSWQLKIGTEDFYNGGGDPKMLTFIDFGVGSTVELSTLKSEATFLIDGIVNYGEGLRKAVSPSLKPQINLISNVSDSLKLNLNIGRNFFLNDGSFDYTEYKIQQNFVLKKDLSFKAQYFRRDFEGSGDENEFVVGFNYYF